MFEYKEASELAAQLDRGELFLTWLAYGRIGTGKTHFASTFPNPFFVVTDAQVLGLVALRSAGYAEVSELDDIFSILADAENRRARFGIPDRPINTIVLDGLTECTDLATKAVRGGDMKKPMSQQLWGFASDRVRMLMRQIISLRTKYHIVVTAKASTIDDTLEGSKFGVPDTIGKFQHIVGGMFHENVYCTQRTVYSAEKKQLVPEFKLHTTMTDQFPAVDRTGRLSAEEPNDFRLLQPKLYKR